MRKILSFFLVLLFTASSALAAQESAVTDDPIQKIMDAITEALNMNIGTVTIGDVTYGKAILQPVIPIGPLTLGLYLPIVYKSELFNPADWYRPEGNNEWSFGTDAEFGEDWLARIKDAGTDLLLKIKFVKWGKETDQFFINVGNLNDMTLGHGLVMQDFANDAEFPTVRRMGVDLGFDFGFIGLEALTNDLLNPNIFGTRIFIRPIPKFPLNFGVTGVADIDPFTGLSDTDVTYAGYFGYSPYIIGGAVDIDFPVFRSDFFSLVVYSDAAAQTAYLGEVPAGSSLTPGFQKQAVLTDDNKLVNVGLAAGVMGNIAAFDWNVGARFFNGSFIPGYFSNNYERLRASRAADLVTYLENPNDTAYDNFIFGVLGEGGYTMPKVFSISSGYMWPWELTDTGIVVSPEDYFMFRFILEKGVIPYVDLGFSLSFERNKLIAPFFTDDKPVIGNFADFADYMLNENTTFNAEAVMGLGGGDLVISFGLVLKRDTAGKIMTDENGIPMVDITQDFEFRF